MVVLMIVSLGLSIPWSIVRHLKNDLPYSRDAPHTFLTLTFVLATRNSVIGFLSGMSFENQLILHKFFCYLSLLTGTIHGVECIIDATYAHRQTRIGTAFLGSMYILALTGIFFKWAPKLFEWFYRIHWVFYIAVLGLAKAHGPKYVLYVGGGMLFADFFLRLVFAGFYRQETIRAKLSVAADNVVKISFSKQKSGFNYEAGQYVFLNIPKITYLEFHPFSVSSCQYEDEVVFFIRVLGDWTKKLHKLA